MPARIKKLWKSNNILRLATGIIGGALAGYAYYYFIGCNTGTCAITGSPVNSTAYGAVMGMILFFPTKKTKQD